MFELRSFPSIYTDKLIALPIYVHAATNYKFYIFKNFVSRKDFENDMLNVHHAILDEVFPKEVKRNEEKCKVWEAYMKGHQKVSEALQSLQKDVHVNCMIPIGKRALMKGKLIHTNEVLACLGDGYFAKYSTAGATALCERRIKDAEEMLKKFNAERDLFETMMLVAENDVFEDGSRQEIVEHWNVDQIAEWKKHHREREREYHQKLAKLRQEEKIKIETEEDLFNRLDQLEIEEELADEYNRLEGEKYELFDEELGEDECYYETESETESEEENIHEQDELVNDSGKRELEEPLKAEETKKSVSFAEPKEFKKSENNVLKKEMESNRDSEDLTEDISRIEFVHSKNNLEIKSNGKLVETPADIYRIYYKPKPILKRSPNDVNPPQLGPLVYNIEEEEEEDEEAVIKPSAYETVVKDITERNTMPIVTEIPMIKEEVKDSRPVSKFKRDRQLKRQ